jgi:sugar O-acyltransferase (sialic acid O-acetyltransferase NeuD family)
VTRCDLGHLDLVLLGGGGHAKVLLDCLEQLHPGWAVAVLDPDTALHGTRLLGARVLGGDDLAGPLAEANSGLRFAVGVGAARSTALRTRLFENALEAGLRPLSLVHPTACVSRWAVIEEGAQILAGAIVNAGARVGANTIINTGAIIEHDCIVGRNAHVATGACLAGAVRVGDGAMIGIGAVVRQGQSIGATAMVGAGAVVVGDIAPGTLVAGIPARPLAEKEKTC